MVVNDMLRNWSRNTIGANLEGSGGIVVVPNLNLHGASVRRRTCQDNLCRYVPEAPWLIGQRLWSDLRSRCRDGGSALGTFLEIASANIMSDVPLLA